MATNQKPIHQLRVGSVRASIWEHLSDNGPFLTVTFSRSYKDKQDQWKDGHSYPTHDIESLLDVAIDAKDWMRRYRQSPVRAA